jgi:hypothetical protein
MTGRFNWSRISSRDRMHRQGVEGEIWLKVRQSTSFL